MASNKVIQLSSTSENDLLYLANKLGINIKFIGSIHSIKNLLPGNYLLLISPNKKKSGHWVSLCIKKDKAFYFDSYGQPPPRILEDNLKHIWYNKQQIQALNQSHCGQFSLYFLYYINKKGSKEKNYNDFLNHFHIQNSYGISY